MLLNQIITQMSETQTQAPVEAKPANISKESFFSQLQEATVGLAKTIAEKHDLPEDSILECIPQEIQIKTVNLKTSEKPKKPKKEKVEKITDYRKAEKLDDLKSFKLEELKNICSENNLAISGSKPILMNRVWSINNPEDCPEEMPKKKGRKPKDASSENSNKEKKPRKSKKKEQNISPAEPTKIEEANIEEENTELDPENMEDICIDDDGNRVDIGRNLKVFDKKWIFEDDDESMEFVGVLENEDKVTFLDEPPSELTERLKSINNE